jgi:hypothetical protein
MWLEKTRHLQISLSDTGSAADSASEQSIGRVGKPFTFEDSPCPLVMCSAQAKHGKVAPVLDFLAKLSK